MTSFLVAGDALLDVHATPAEPIRPGSDVPAVVRLGVGGQGANLAVRLARHGTTVRLAYAAGQDDLAPLVRGRLDAAGVEVVPIPAAATGAVIILLDDVGERTMLSQRVPFARALADSLPSIAADADWVVLSGYLLEEPGPGIEASHVPSARRAVVGSPFRDPAAWLAAVTSVAPQLLVLNRDEAASLVEPTDARDGAAPVAAALAVILAPTLVVITEASGAMAVGPGMEPVVVTQTPDPAAVDTTGAGDAFAATLLGEIAGDFPPGPDVLRAALERAGTVAAAVSRVVGAQATVRDPEATA